MEKLIIHKLGPFNDCEMEIRPFMILTGPQAAGKSTIAKCVFFFGNLKNILVSLVQRSGKGAGEDVIEMSLYRRFLRDIRNNFLQIFGTTWAMDPEMRIEYIYENGAGISVRLSRNGLINNYAFVSVDEELANAVDSIEKKYCVAGEMPVSPSDLRKEIYETVFSNSFEIVYIPAGRSMITLLSDQINYIYSTMDDQQKRSMDFCTQSYLEKILQIKPFFREGFEPLIIHEKMMTDRRIKEDVLQLAAQLNRKILKGEYRNVDGDERLQISPERYVKINYASSGQQEAVWILNVLFYYMLSNRKTMFIIEEPESHLYPDAQKTITEYIALTAGAGNHIVMTTHSPYVLGNVNNLLYASHLIPYVNTGRIAALCDPRLWIHFEDLRAYHVVNGRIEDCTDREYENIENDVIDGASDEINELFEAMVELAHHQDKEV